jgi:PadR family transcriptional regulator, regulatory protein PadR
MTESRSEYILRGSADGLLLFLINETEQSYGYQIIREIEKRSEGYLRFKEGTVYPALHKLENQGLIYGEWSELPNGQQRRCYRITDKGRNELDERIRAWVGFQNAVNLIFKPSRA